MRAKGWLSKLCPKGQDIRVVRVPGLSISFDSKIIQACCCLQVVKRGDIVISPLEEFSTLRTSCLYNGISYTVKKISSWSDVCNPRKTKTDMMYWLGWLSPRRLGSKSKFLRTHNVNLLCTLNNTYPDDLIVPIWHMSRQFSCLGKCKIVTWSYYNRSFDGKINFPYKLSIANPLSNGSQRFSGTCDLPSTFDSAFLDTGSLKPVSPNFILIWKIYVSIREGIQH